MGRALFVASGIASALLLLSCQKNQSPQVPPAAVADAKNCFSLMQDLPFWNVSGAGLAQAGSIQVGEKLALLGQSRRAMQGGKERVFLHVRRDTGTEGWVRSDYVVSNAILAVVTSDDAVIYSVPRNTAATTATIPRTTVLVIYSDSGGMPFIRVSAYDPQQKVLLKEVYLRNEGVSARPDDVQAAILLQLASDSKNSKQQEAFLTSAIKDYPGSLFMPQLQEALNALQAPPLVATPPAGASQAREPQAGAPQSSPLPSTSSAGPASTSSGAPPAVPASPPQSAPPAKPPSQPSSGTSTAQ
jgi:hypothetical protein